MEYFSCHQSLDIGQINTCIMSETYLISLNVGNKMTDCILETWEREGLSPQILEVRDEEMETSYSADIWSGCDDSQDYWESNLSCIHCPGARGG